MIWSNQGTRLLCNRRVCWITYMKNQSYCRKTID